MYPALYLPSKSSSSAFEYTNSFSFSVATIAIAYDNAPYARKPVEWALPKVWVISSIMGLMLAGGTWIVRGTLFSLHGGDHGGIVQNFGRFVTHGLKLVDRGSLGLTFNSLQEVIFLEVALTESWIIFITRLPQGPDAGEFQWPSFQLLAAVLGVDILATLFALFGWISGGAAHGGWVSCILNRRPLLTLVILAGQISSPLCASGRSRWV